VDKLNRQEIENKQSRFVVYLGYGSRKFLMTFFCLFLLVTMCLLFLKYPTLENILPTFVSGLLGILGLYLGGNVAQKVFTKDKEVVTDEENEEGED